MISNKETIFVAVESKLTHYRIPRYNEAPHGVKKSKPPTLPRFHEMKVDEIVAKHKRRYAHHKKRIKESKIIKESTQKMIEESSLRKKK